MKLATELENLPSSLFQAIVEQAPDAIIFADRQGIIRIWNDGAQAVFGYSADEILGQSLDIIIPERFRQAHWDAFQRAIDTGHTKYSRLVRTTRSIHKSGTKLYVDLSFGLVRNETGTVTGAMAVGRDCTARHLSETAGPRG